LSKENDSLLALMEAIIQECGSFSAKVTCFKSIISKKDKEHKVEVDTIQNEFTTREMDVLNELLSINPRNKILSNDFYGDFQ